MSATGAPEQPICHSTWAATSCGMPSANRVREPVRLNSTMRRSPITQASGDAAAHASSGWRTICR